jgi:hypothetical protein
MHRDARRSGFSELTYFNLKPLLNAKRFTATIDIGDDSRIDAALTFPDARAAGKGQEAARFGLQLLRGGIGYLEEEIGKAFGGEEKLDGTKVALMMTRLREACNEAQVKVDGATLNVAAKVKTEAENVRAVITEVRPKIEAAANRVRSAQNLRQLGLALHSYHDTMGALPPLSSLYDRQGNPNGLSWRVHLLPYVEEMPLYRQFRLDEPWDSDHNKKLIAQMPKIFAAPGVKTKEAGMTFYQAIASSPGEQIRTVFVQAPNARQRLYNIPDGASNTIAFVEAAEPVIWMKPDDIVFNPRQKLLPKLGGVFEDGFNIAFCDGAVRFLRKKEAGEELVKALATANGGEVVRLPGDEDDEDRPGKRFKDKGSGKDKKRPFIEEDWKDRKDGTVKDVKTDKAPEFDRKDFERKDR